MSTTQSSVAEAEINPLQPLMALIIMPFLSASICLTAYAIQLICWAQLIPCTKQRRDPAEKKQTILNI